MESFRKKYSTKPRESLALTWGIGSNTLPSIFSADLSKVFRKFLSPLQGPRKYIDRTWERSANYTARTFSCSCYRAKPKWSSAIDMSGDTPQLICIWLNFSSSVSLCSVLLFLLIYGKQSQAFFKGRLEVILEFTLTSVDSHIANPFLVSRDSKNKESGSVHCN